MSEFSVEPSKIMWLGEKFGYVGHIEEDIAAVNARLEGDERADKIINAWASDPGERAFLEALSAGHEIAEARRVSGLSRSRADRLLRRIRGS